MAQKALDLTGKRFGKLLVLQRSGDTRKVRWQCRCDCGVETVVRSDVLTSGSANSCGCSRGEFIGQANRRHGLSGTPTYQAWINMVRRCTNPNVKHFARYGGRGIRVCERWMIFENFLEDMGIRPDGRSIERDDNDGHYEPGNCSWANSKQQARNRRNTKFVLLHGERMSLTEAAERLEMSPHSLRAKIRRGHPVEGVVA